MQLLYQMENWLILVQADLFFFAQETIYKALNAIS
jgi:hypothetical protein